MAESTELESESLRIAPLSKRAQALPGLLSIKEKLPTFSCTKLDKMAEEGRLELPIPEGIAALAEQCSTNCATLPNLVPMRGIEPLPRRTRF